MNRLPLIVLTSTTLSGLMLFCGLLLTDGHDMWAWAALLFTGYWLPSLCIKRVADLTEKLWIWWIPSLASSLLCSWFVFDDGSGLPMAVCLMWISPLSLCHLGLMYAHAVIAGLFCDWIDRTPCLPQ